MDDLQQTNSSHKKIIIIFLVAGISLLVIGGIVWYTVSQRASVVADIALIDSDGDILSDADEIKLGTDVNKEDTDGDGLSDYMEVQLKTDPKNPHSLNADLLDRDIIVTQQLEQEQKERDLRINKLKK